MCVCASMPSQEHARFFAQKRVLEGDGFTHDSLQRTGVLLPPIFECNYYPLAASTFEANSHAVGSEFRVYSRHPTFQKIVFCEIARISQAGSLQRLLELTYCKDGVFKSNMSALCAVRALHRVL